MSCMSQCIWNGNIYTSYKINDSFDCNYKWLTYLLICKTCFKQYVGGTTDRLRGAVVMTTVQFHSTNHELGFCAGSNPTRGVSEIRDSEDLWQWFRLKIRSVNHRLSTIPQKQFNLSDIKTVINAMKICERQGWLARTSL